MFVLLFLYFKSRGQISRVRCAVVTRLPASEKLVPSTLSALAELILSRTRLSRATLSEHILEIAFYEINT